MNWQPGRQPPMMGGHRIAERVAALEKELADLKKAVAVSATGIVIKSPGSISIEAASNAQIRAGASLDLDAGGTADLRGSLVRLNGGGAPIARVGDIATGVGGPAPITGPGNPTVMG